MAGKLSTSLEYPLALLKGLRYSLCPKVTAPAKVFPWPDSAPSGPCYAGLVSSVYSSGWVLSPLCSFFSFTCPSWMTFQAGTVPRFRTSGTSLWFLPGALMAPEMPPLQGCLAGVASMEKPKYVSSGTEAYPLNHSIPERQVCKEQGWVPLVLTWLFLGTHEHITFPLPAVGGISICSSFSSDSL